MVKNEDKNEPKKTARVSKKVVAEQVLAEAPSAQKKSTKVSAKAGVEKPVVMEDTVANRAPKAKTAKTKTTKASVQSTKAEEFPADSNDATYASAEKPVKRSSRSKKPLGNPSLGTDSGGTVDGVTGSSDAVISTPTMASPFLAPAPVSATSLMFMAPDLPTPRVSAKGIASEKSSDESHLRRRSRRREGEAVDVDSNSAPNVVVKVRTPREPKELSNEPTRIKGSTRLEAKKQRRRDGRDTGRRRTTITESEFLARRESVDRTMVVRSKDGKIQIGVLEDGILVEHYVAKASEASLIGNVYLGKVQNVLPSMEAAFVDVGRGRNAVLYSGEVDWELAETGNKPRRIEMALKSGDTVLVQVTKDPIGQKGARLTSQVSLPGRYLVYVPNGSMNGISRKLPDSERARLKKILKDVLPEDAGVIVRTAAEGATEEQLTLDVERLKQQWDAISKKIEKSESPILLHSEPDLLVKIVRDVFNEDFEKMVISGDDAREVIEEYLGSVAPDLLERVVKHEGQRDVFDEYRIGEQIAKALDRKVYLPSGGSLVIDRTEAMTVVDVNTGKFVGSGGNLEETVTKNNLEAAEEIVRQLRLRDIGGIIVVDFIDMVLESNRDLVQRRLMECLSRDRTKHQVAEVTSLGLVQMTRKKLGIGLLEAFSEPCEVCDGRGVVVFPEPIMRSKHHHVDDQKPNQQQGQGKRKNRDRNQKQESVKVVTPESAIEMSSVMSKIAASSSIAPNSSTTEGFEDISTATSRVSNKKTPAGGKTLSGNEKILEAVLEALPEPKAPGQGRRKPRRATSNGIVTTSQEISQ